MVIFTKHKIVFLSGWLGLLLALAGCRPATPAESFQRGMDCYHDSDWSGAITNFTKCLESAFNVPEACRYRAYAWAKAGDGRNARTDCQRLIHLAPGQSGSYYWAAQVEYALADYDAAVVDFEMGQRIGSRDCPADLADNLALHCAGRAYDRYAAGELPGALKGLDEALQLSPTNAALYSLRGWVKFYAHDIDGAIADNERTFHYQYSFPDIYTLRAWLRLDRGDISGAKTDARQAVELWPKYQAPVAARSPETMAGGLLAYLNGEDAKAIEQWNQLLALNSDLPQPVRAFLQNWIAKAKARLSAVPVGRP